jgi:hypothetical protein
MASLRAAVALATLALLQTGPVAAQDAPGSSSRPDADTADVLVLDHDFTSGGEFVRVFLENRQVYRAELGSPDLGLDVRAIPQRIRAPRVYAFLGSDSPSGASIVEIYPDVDAEYEIRPIDRGGGRVGTTLRLYRDATASGRRLAMSNRHAWDVGIELAAGWHSGFARLNIVPGTTAAPRGGRDFEGCFSARAAPDRARFHMCAFGIGYQSQVGASNIVWFFTEPRFGILGRAKSGRSNWELGALFRAGVGAIGGHSTANPFVFAPGAYLARQIRTNTRGSGWSIQASYSHNLYLGFPTSFTSPAVERPQSDRLTLGLGWYQ